jgi:hypothetical protein
MQALESRADMRALPTLETSVQAVRKSICVGHVSVVASDTQPEVVDVRTVLALPAPDVVVSGGSHILV